MTDPAPIDLLTEAPPGGRRDIHLVRQIRERRDRIMESVGEGLAAQRVIVPRLDLLDEAPESTVYLIWGDAHVGPEREMVRDALLYVGQTVAWKRRWYRHRKAMTHCGHRLTRVRFLSVPRGDLGAVEAACIRFLRPLLNKKTREAPSAEDHAVMEALAP